MDELIQYLLEREESFRISKFKHEPGGFWAAYYTGKAAAVNEILKYISEMEAHKNVR